MAEEEKTSLNKRRFIEKLKRQKIIQAGTFMFQDGIKLDYKVDFGKKCRWPTCSVLGEELGKLVSSLLPNLQLSSNNSRKLAIIVTATRIHRYSLLSYLYVGTQPGVNTFLLDELENDTLLIKEHDLVVLFEDVLSTGSNLDELVDEIEPFLSKVCMIIVGFDHGIGGMHKLRQVFPETDIEVLMSAKDMEQAW